MKESRELLQVEYSQTGLVSHVLGPLLFLTYIDDKFKKLKFVVQVTGQDTHEVLCSILDSSF